MLQENLLLEALNHELEKAGPGVAGNRDFLRAVLAASGDCIKILDLEGRLLFMSEGGKRVMEVENFESLRSCPWPEFWSGEGHAQALAAVAEARAGRTARFRNAANTAKGNPRYWDVQVSPILDAEGAPSHLLSISRDITEEWTAAETQRASIAREKLLADELKHRVKNTLANVIAIARQTFRDQVHREAREAFNERLGALSSAYDILSESNWSSSPIRRVVEGGLAPYRTRSGQFSISGPEVDLSSRRSLALALATNELATNAMKYGALSRAEGRVDVSWELLPLPNGPWLRFAWRETGGPAVSAPSRAGFGSRLIQSVLAQEFGGVVELRYPPEGLVCVLEAEAAVSTG